jgi:hypothetical protein
VVVGDVAKVGCHDHVDGRKRDCRVVFSDHPQQRLGPP